MSVGTEAPLLLVGRWRAASPTQQREAVEAVDAAWDAVGRPEGMTAHVAMAADDAATVVNLSSWRDREAIGRFTGGAKSRWWAEVERAVPGLERLAVHAYSRYGGLVTGAGEPGCLVLVDIAADDAEAASSWMDAMLDLGRIEAPAVGMLSATFYLDADGTRALNVAEWTSPHAHEAFLGAERSDASRGLITQARGARPVGFLRGAR